MFNILVCEDDRNIRKLMSEYLTNAHYHVYESHDGKMAIEIFQSHHIDMVITDLMMPNYDGYELTSYLRTKDSQLPILIITAKETLDDKRKAFNSGTDDYMTKPIAMDEMLLRVAALLRRAKITSDQQIIIGNTTIDYPTMTVTSNSERVELAKKEFLVLFKLLSRPNHIYTRQQLMDEIWGYENFSDEQTVNVHISRLRDKFADNQDFNIVTVKGIGYKAVKR